MPETASTRLLIDTVWNEKYRAASDTSVTDTIARVVNAVYVNDVSHMDDAMQCLNRMDFIPGGRILAGAGTGKNVTLINCYVAPDIEDSLDSIMDCLKSAAVTMQQGGGIGMGFSTIRPRGALVKRTGSVSSGVIPFLRMWNAMCGTIMSSGSRRGAMMATLRCDHPDILEFIEAKHTKGELTNFNLSVLITDAFMRAVKDDKPWKLTFPVKPAVGGEEFVINGTWSYYTIGARELWQKILRSTYEYAEPGVIFIDKINRDNNLSYCETLHCTNPCGEQPLPAHGDCCLGAINYANMVTQPFSTNAHIDYDRLEKAVRVGVRFLDNVLDVTNYPHPEQQVEAMLKRRIGLGMMGIGNMLQMLQIRYGSQESLQVVDAVLAHVATIAYGESIHLAASRGAFPAFDAEKYVLESPQSFVGKLGHFNGVLRRTMREYGMRNSHVLTGAPTGTTAIFAGNVSSAGEPPFAFTYSRKLKMATGAPQEHVVEDYGYAMFKQLHGAHAPLPAYMVTAADVTVEEHVRMQSVIQNWTDSAVSKTVNCPKEMTFEAFEKVYDLAYALDCKGCTTYRPSDVRGSVLSLVSPEPTMTPEQMLERKADGTFKVQLPLTPEPKIEVTELTSLINRPYRLDGTTYKFTWGDHAYYITINDDAILKRPLEIFINTKDVRFMPYLQAISRMVSAVFRRGGDISFVYDELGMIHDPAGGKFVDINGDGTKYVQSLIAAIARVLKIHCEHLNEGDSTTLNLGTATATITQVGPTVGNTVAFDICPKCMQNTYIHQGGCDQCTNPECLQSTCG